MRGRKSRWAKLLSIPVLAACGFVIAATVAGGGLFASTVDPTTGSTPGSGTPTPAPTPSPNPTPSPSPSPTPTVPPTTPPPATTPPPKFEGCTPGFWKNHLTAWPDAYSPTDTLGGLFTGLEPALASRTLLSALNQGRGGLDALLRHAVAALLNAGSIDYPLTTGQIIDMVNEAIASADKDTIESLKDTLDEFNNLGGC
jgi:hypothetical protein